MHKRKNDITITASFWCAFIHKDEVWFMCKAPDHIAHTFLVLDRSHSTYILTVFTTTSYEEKVNGQRSKIDQ